MKLANLYNAIVPCLAAIASAATAPHRHGRTFYVKEGEKIQKWINKAPPGSEIVVAPGNYTEYLLITKDGIHLRGEAGAILSPPKHATDNLCSGNVGGDTQAGICIAGYGIDMDDFKVEHRKVRSVQKPVRGVSVSGMQVQHFSANILALGAEDTRIEHNMLIDGSQYGFLTSGSRNTVAYDNTIASSNQPGFIAMCMDNFSGMKAMNNGISNYFVGFCVQTDGAYLHDNDVSLTCAGAFVDPYVNGAKFVNNHVHNLSPPGECFGFGPWGVTLSGATNSLVEGNCIEHIDGTGIRVTDDPCTADENALSCLDNIGVLVVAKGNHIVGNYLAHNNLDISNDSKGAGNFFEENHCSKSSPPRLCRS